MSIKPPPGFKFSEQQTNTSFKFSEQQTASPSGGTKPKETIRFGVGGKVVFPDVTSKEFEDQAVMKDMKSEARKRLREFETTTLKELGEDGWTLRSVNEVYIEPDMTTYVYYFSRPL